jgi:LysM repeat protein
MISIPSMSDKLRLRVWRFVSLDAQRGLCYYVDKRENFKVDLVKQNTSENRRIVMNKKLSIVLLVVIVLGAVLTACERPASTPLSTTPGAGDIPFPVQQPTTSVSVFGTQTAIAAKATPGGPTATAVPGATKSAAQATAAVPAATKPAVQPTQPAAPQPTEAKPEVVLPSAPPGRPADYTVQQGDHYICIARRFNLSLEEFFSTNGLSMNSQAVVGKTVKISQGGSWNSANGSRTLKAHPDTYTVASGDTLNKIACSYGDADPNLIALANDLKAPYSLSAGQSLKIP